MSGYRIVQGPLPQANFTMVSNFWLRDPRLSWEARALLVWLISHEPAYEVDEKKILAAGCAKRDKVRRMISELEKCGYLVRTRERDERGRLGGVLYTITDPWAHAQPQVGPNDGKSVMGGQGSGHAESKPQVGPKDGKANVGSANVGSANVGSPAPNRRTTEEEKTKDQEDYEPPVAAVDSPAVRIAREAPAPSAQPASHDRPSRRDETQARSVLARIRRYREAPGWVRTRHLTPMVIQALKRGFGEQAIIQYALMVAAEERFADHQHIPEFRQALRRLGRDVALGSACAADGLDPAACPCGEIPFGPEDRPWSEADQAEWERILEALGVGEAELDVGA